MVKDSNADLTVGNADSPGYGRILKKYENNP